MNLDDRKMDMEQTYTISRSDLLRLNFLGGVAMGLMTDEFDVEQALMALQLTDYEPESLGQAVIDSGDMLGLGEPTPEQQALGEAIFGSTTVTVVAIE